MNATRQGLCRPVQLSIVKLARILSFTKYSKACVKQTDIGFQYTNYSLMQVKSIAECSNGKGGGAFCNTFDIIKLPFVIKILVLSIFEWPFYTGFTVASSAIVNNKGGDQTARICRLVSAFCSYATKSGFLATSANNRSREQMFYSHFVLVYVSDTHCTCCMKHANKLDNFTFNAIATLNDYKTYPKLHMNMPRFIPPTK